MKISSFPDIAYVEIDGQHYRLDSSNATASWNEVGAITRRLNAVRESGKPQVYMVPCTVPQPDGRDQSVLLGVLIRPESTVRFSIADDKSDNFNELAADVMKAHEKWEAKD